MQLIKIVAKLVIVLVLVVSMFVGCKEKALTLDDKIRNTSIISKEFVKARLKSPSTADFPFAEYQGIETATNRWRVKSYVDSQNGFGAMVRTTYIIELEYTGSSYKDDWFDQSKYKLVSLDMN